MFEDTADCQRRIDRGGWAEDAALHRCTPPIGPRNTWSNLAYLVAGAVLWGAYPHSPPALLTGLALVVLGLGSGLYHYFKTKWANKLDHFGMYAVFGCLGVYGIAPRHPQIVWAMAVTAVLLAGLLTYVVPKVNLDLQMGVLLWFAGTAAILNGTPALVFPAFGLFVTGFLCWNLDKRGSALVGLWGHALWHTLTAAALAAMFVAQTP